MTDALTYSLRLNKLNSDEYYQKIANLAERWLSDARLFAAGTINEYLAYRRSFNLKERSFDELAFEMLALGVELYEHGAQAAGYPYWAAHLLDELVEKQTEIPFIENAIKTLRGLVSGLGSSLTGNIKPGELETIAITRAAGKPLPVGGEPDVGCTLYVQRLIQWLRSQGRITQAKRFAEWDAFIESFEPQKSQEIILQAITLAHEFDIESAPELDVYTAGIAEYLHELTPQTAWRYDDDLVKRSRLEYHLGMLGTEILNRAYRERFAAAKRKVVLAPACMRARQMARETEEKCQALETPLGSLCQGCTSSCRVHQITQMGKKFGFEVFIFPDRKRNTILQDWGKEEGVSIAEIACALTAWEYGWDLEDAGVPAQGLLLDYATCKDYWNPARPDDSDIVTDTNISKIKEFFKFTRPSDFPDLATST